MDTKQRCAITRLFHQPMHAHISGHGVRQVTCATSPRFTSSELVVQSTELLMQCVASQASVLISAGSLYAGCCHSKPQGKECYSSTGNA